MPRKLFRMNDLDREVGARLRAIRKARRLPGHYAAKRMGLSQAQISRLECGQQGLRAVTLRRACKVLKVSPAVLFIEKPLARKLLKSPLGKEIPGLDLIL